MFSKLLGLTANQVSMPTADAEIITNVTAMAANLNKNKKHGLADLNKNIV